jgi:large subunit ribosomal protein L16
MFSQPKKSKYNKVQGLRLRPMFRSSEISFGEYSLVTTEPGRITARQLEVLRRMLSRGLGRQGKIWFKVFPHIPQTDKPKEARMGKGKGVHSYWGLDVPGGTTIVEYTGISPILASSLSKKLSHKLGVTTKHCQRELPIF